MDKHISDTIPIYTKYLTDVNLCINLFNKLESDRTWGDWFVGDRGKINTKRLSELTSELKEKLEKIISIYTTLSSDIEYGNKMELGYQERSKSNLHLNYFNGELIVKRVEDLSTPTPMSTPEVDYSRCKEQTYDEVIQVGSVVGVVGSSAFYVTLAALSIIGPFTLLTSGVGIAIGAIATFTLAQSNINSCSKRGLEYQKLKVFYDSLNNTEMLSNLQTHCLTMQELSDNVDKRLERYKQEYGTYRQAIVQKNAGKELNKAFKLYSKTLQSETEQLKSSEPDMGEDMRKRMATKIAASNCKTFLKQSLDYSDSDAEEFINGLQS